jgi:hypothetical protein
MPVDATSVPAFFFLPDGGVNEGVVIPSLGNETHCNLSGSYAVSGGDLTISYQVVSASGQTVTESCDYAMAFSNGGNELDITPTGDAGCGTALQLERVTAQTSGNCF